MASDASDDFNLNELINPILVIEEPHFGPGPSLTLRRVRLQLAPSFALSVRAFLQRNNQSTFLSDALRVCDVWIVFHTVNVSPDGKTSGPEMIGVEVEFDESARVVVQDTFPRSEFIHLARGRAEFRGGIGFNGEAYGAEASVGASLLAELAFELQTPKVVASGRFSNRAEWMFYKHERPLLGDFVLATSILVPKGTSDVPFLCRLRAAVPSVIPGLAAPFVPTKWERRICTLSDGVLPDLISLRPVTLPTVEEGSR
jgi:hypothetical protein